MSDTPSPPPTSPRIEPAALARVAEVVLTETFVGTIQLGEAEMLRDRGRNRVARFPVIEGPEGVPASVVVKTATGEGENDYDPAKGLESDANRRFFHEWTGNRFLTERSGEEGGVRVGARFYGGRRDSGVIVLEDLGAPHSLADHMQADDRPVLEMALVQYAASMGRMHAVTAGRKDAFDRLYAEISGVAPKEGEKSEDFSPNADRFRDYCTKLGVPIATGFDEDIAEVRRLLNTPGPFEAFKPGDTCPDNHRLMDDGWARFFDFEFAGFGHCLLDAAYFYMPFPTCWCVNRLPDDQIARMEAAYRSELAKGCPAAGDDTIFLPALAAACAFWAIGTLAWGLEGALKEDGRWGISTVRQRHPLRLENFARIAERAGTLPALAETCRTLAAHLRNLWPETEPMPFYSAFRESI